MKIVYDHRRFWASMSAILVSFFSGQMIESLAALNPVLSTVQDLECFSIRTYLQRSLTIASYQIH